MEKIIDVGRKSAARARGWIVEGWPWAALLLISLWGVRPPGVLVTMPSQQQVQTSNPVVGVHTRLTDEVEEWKIQRSLALVREMGAPWIVEYFPWAYYEPERGRYDWTHPDTVIRHARNQGITVIARLGMTPDWARPDPKEQETTNTYLDAEGYIDFANFVAAFATRYKENVQHIVIWNEPNLSFEWGYRPVDPVAYVDLLRVVYPAAHAANPDVVVLGGALAPTLEPVDSPVGLNDLLYLEAMYAAGGGAYFDALSAHAYGLGFAPETLPNPALINFRRVELLREIMDVNGDADKPIYVTEAGWNDHPRWTWAVKPGLRIQYTLDAYTWAAEQWPWCPVVAMWMLRTPAKLRNYQDYYAYVTPDFQQRMIYTAVQAYTGNTVE